MNKQETIMMTFILCSISNGCLGLLTKLKLLNYVAVYFYHIFKILFKTTLLSTYMYHVWCIFISESLENYSCVKWANMEFINPLNVANVILHNELIMLYSLVTRWKQIIIK